VSAKGPATAFESTLSTAPLRPPRRVLPGLVAVLVLLAVVVPFTWWQVSAQTYHLTGGGAFYGHEAVTMLSADDGTEFCYAATPGAIITFGFEVDNDGRAGIFT